MKPLLDLQPLLFNMPVELVPGLYVGPGKILLDIEVDRIVSLDCGAKPTAPNRPRERCLHITDFDVEPVRNIGLAIKEIDEARSRGERVYLHCRAGCGRTGTVAIAYLIYLGKRLEEASNTFWRARGCGPSTYRQTLLLEAFQEAVDRLGPREALETLINSSSLEDFIAKIHRG